MRDRSSPFDFPSMGRRLMSWRLMLPLAALMLVLVASATLSGPAEEAPCKLALDGRGDMLPAYVVSSGNGTAGNPYIIEDQVIRVSSGGIGIDIRNSKAYYIIRNVTIIGTQSNDYGIFFSVTSNVTVDGLVLRTLTIPLYTTGCARIRFQNVTVDDCFQGIQLWSTASCTFVNMSLTNFMGIGMVATGCSNLSLEGCSARNTTTGGFEFIARLPRIPGCRNISLVGCAASDAGMGLAFSDADGCTIDGCNFTGGWPADVHFKDTRNLTMLDTDLGNGGLLIELGCGDLDVRDSNTVAGKPLRFVKGSGKAVVNSDVGQVVLADCEEAIVENLTFQGIANPVTVLGSSGCTVRNCTFTDAHVAVRVLEGDSNRLENLTITDGGYPYSRFGVEAIHGDLVIDGLNVTEVEYGVHALEGHRLEISNASFTNLRWSGVLAEASTYQTRGVPVRDLIVSDCVFKDAIFGIQSSNWNLTVRDCRLERCGNTGLMVGSSGYSVDTYSYAKVERTEVVDCQVVGVTIDKVACKLTSLSVRGSMRGIILGGSECTVWRCTISDCGTGIYIPSGWLVTVYECTVRDCTRYGIQVSSCYRTKIYHNNFIGNYYDDGLGRYTDRQAYDIDDESQWDDGSEGNYWADYSQWYPDATAQGRTWDTPYVLPGPYARRDRFPLTTPYDFTPPVAEAGPEQYVGPNQTVWFDGSYSSDDIGIVNYTWEFVDQGQPVSLHGLTASHVFSEMATYTVTLWVIDGWGHTASDTTKVHVVDLVPPVAVAGEDLTVDVGRTFTLDGSRSTDDQGIALYTWTVDPGGLNLTFGTVIATLSIDRIGDYDVVLNVTDARGNWATDSLVVHVRDLSPPVADAGPDVEVDQHATVTFNGSGSTDNVGVVLWTWSFRYDGEDVTLGGATVEFTFDSAGLYQVVLTVLDPTFSPGHDDMFVRVRDTEPPEADAGSDIAVPHGTTVELVGVGSKDNVGPVGFNWTLLVDGVLETHEGPVASIAGLEVGVYVVTLNVTDAAGNWATDTVVVTVRDVMPPLPDAGPDIDVDQHASLTLDAAGSTDDVGIVSFVWTFREGEADVVLEGRVATHAFDVVGEYNVTLTVADAAGNSASDGLVVRVRDIEPPVAVAGADRTVVEGDRLTLDATASHDNVGIVGYVWTVIGDAGTETLTGAVVAVSTSRPGTLRIELRATDAAGNSANDTLEVRVLALNVSWRLGPFMDEDDRHLKGVRVSVTLNGTVRTGITDGTGWLDISVLRFDLVSPAHVNASLRGYDTLRFTTALDADGQPVDPVPRMSKVPGANAAMGLLWWLLLAVVIVCAVVAVALYRRGRGRGPPNA